MFQRAFSVSTREPAARLFDPGGHSPTRGFVVCAALVHAFYRTSVRSNVCLVDVLRVVWYRAGTFLCMRSWPCPSWPSVMPWLCPSCRGVPGYGRGVPWPWLWRPPSLCRRRVVATRRRMLVFAMVLAVSVLSQFALRLQGVYSESHQANDNERNGDEREATTTETTTARTVTRSPLTGVAWMIEN